MTEGLLLIRNIFKGRLWWVAAWNLGLAANFIALVFIGTQPAADSLPYFKYLDKQCKKTAQTLWAQDEDPYCLVGLKSNFYKPENLKVIIFEKTDSLPLNAMKKGEFILMRNPGSGLNHNKFRQIELQYSRIPDWLYTFNFGRWQERSKIWEIWQVKN